MAKVSININGRKYALGCDDGEEARLSALGAKLDERVKTLANQFGQIGDLRLLVMAGITMLDELEDVESMADQRAESLAADIRKASEEAISSAGAQQTEAIGSLLKAARRIEALSESLQRE